MKTMQEKIEVYVYKNTQYGTYSLHVRNINMDMEAGWKYLGKQTIKVQE